MIMNYKFNLKCVIVPASYIKTIYFKGKKFTFLPFFLKFSGKDTKYIINSFFFQICSSY